MRRGNSGELPGREGLFHITVRGMAVRGRQGGAFVRKVGTIIYTKMYRYL